MKNITINGKEYKIEYSIEASLYEDCTGCIMDYFINAGMVEGAAESGDADRATNYLKKVVTSVPNRTFTLFYAGLLEKQPDITKEEAKALLKKYVDESGKSFTDIMGDLLVIVEEDNFFEMIGLDKMFPSSNTKKKKKEHGESTSTEQ